ncbi:hypothetical protein O9X98_10695 [Agrobacterium salinitolerans]|nr:hypothetical protein [Agrobacterium salinitolerans]
MLTLEAILKTTRQMTAYGEVPGAASARNTLARDYIGNPPQANPGLHAREWDDELKVYRHR